jgi:hypothetical protein
MNNCTANTSSAVKPAPGRVSRVSSVVLSLALRPQPSPMVYVVRAANVVRDLCRVGNAGHRYVSAELAPIDAARAGLKQSAIHARHRELVQATGAYRTYRTRRAA